MFICKVLKKPLADAILDFGTSGLGTDFLHQSAARSYCLSPGQQVAYVKDILNATLLVFVAEFKEIRCLRQ